MHSNHGKRTRGKRAGSSVRQAELRDVHSRIRNNAAHNLHNTSVTALVGERAKYFDCALVEETIETHLVPRESITVQQRLEAFPQRVELAEVPAKQLDRANEIRQAAWEWFKRFKSPVRAKTFDSICELLATLGVGMIGTTDNRIVWKSDKSLLRKGQPFPVDGTFYRQGSVSVGLDKRKTVSLEKDLAVQGPDRGIALDDEE